MGWIRRRLKNSAVEVGWDEEDDDDGVLKAFSVIKENEGGGGQWSRNLCYCQFIWLHRPCNSDDQVLVHGQFNLFLHKTCLIHS